MLRKKPLSSPLVLIQTLPNPSFLKVKNRYNKVGEELPKPSSMSSKLEIPKTHLANYQTRHRWAFFSQHEPLKFGPRFLEWPENHSALSLIVYFSIRRLSN